MKNYFIDENKTFLYQLVYAVIIGILFSCFTCSLAPILLFSVLIECIIYSLCPSNYTIHIRLILIVAYVFGWYLGRTVFELDSYCIDSDYF